MIAAVFVVVGLVVLGLAVGGTHKPTAASGAATPGKATVAASDAPWRLTALPACHPAPCALVGGTEVAILAVHRDLRSMANGFHLVEIVARYTDTTGEHAIDPESDFALLDPAGVWHGTLGLGDSQLPTSCHGPTDFPVTLAPGAHAGPFGICFQAGGPPTGRLLLMYGPASIDACGPAYNEPFVPGAMRKARPARTGSLLVDHPDQCSAAVINL